MRLKRSTAYDPVKRLLDALASLAGLIVLSPVLVVVAILVRTRLGSPVLFKQPRPGLNGRVFNLYKFRTMKNIDEAAGLVSDEQRMTSFGRALRSSSLDELPTLFNVLKGEMSVIGPRPLLVRYLDRYSAEQARRHDVRPGVTGLAQVSGRNSLSWEEKFVLDVIYVDSLSFGSDARIFFRTVKSVAQREGISQDGHVTAEEFRGKEGAGSDG